jgi:hypothetical protein
MRTLLTLSLLLCLASCGGDDLPSEGLVDAVASPDSSVDSDATTATDAESTPDATTTEDAESPQDAGNTADVTPPQDAGNTADAAIDAGSPLPEGCRSHDECGDMESESGTYCATPYDANVCGVPPMEECWSAQDCAGIGPTGMNLSCHAVVDSCSPDGFGSVCGQSCLNNPAVCDGGDPDPLVCGSDGACTPQSCLDGHDCHAVQFCDPNLNSAGPHGCNFVSCQADTDCLPGLYCVLGMCIETLGTCSEVMLVP